MATSRYLFVRRHALLLGALMVYACSDGGGGGCGGCGGGEGPAYVFPADGAVIDQAAQIHVTESGFDFIGENAGPLIGTLLGDGGLSFCLPEQNIEVIGLSLVRVCNGSRCADGTAGCDLTFDIESVEITPVTVPTGSDRLEVALGLGVDESLPLRLLGADCTASITSPPGGIPISANIYFNVDAAREERVSIDFPADELSFALSDDYIDVSGSGLAGLVCGGVNLLAGALLPVLEDQLAGPLEDAIGPALCTSCSTSADCPGGSTCDSDVCVWEGTDECVPLALGVETELDLGDLLADFAPGLEAKLGILAYAANYADAIGPDPAPYVGLDLAAQVGFDSAPSVCVPYEPPPSTARIPKSPSINAELSPSGGTFAVGIGVARSALNLALWAVYNSGALCLRIGTDTIEQVSTGTFSALLPSLGTLTDGENRPMFLQLRPQQSPTVDLGDGVVSYDGDGNPVIEEPLLVVHLDNVLIDFYGFAESRWVRLFTLDADVELPLGLDVNADNQLIVVLGDLTNALARVETLNGELLDPSDTASVASLLPTLLATLLPALGGDLIPPIDIPEIEGIRLVLAPGSITSVDSNEMLAIYADLALAPAGGGGSLTMLPMPQVLATHVAPASQVAVDRMLSEATRTGAPLDLGVLLPRVVLDVDTLQADFDQPQMEYSYRVNGSLWSMWYRTQQLELRHPALALQGQHVIEVRARRVGDMHSVSPHLGQTTVVVDYEGPRVTVTRDGLLAYVDARDVVSRPENLTMRWRVNGGEWSPVTLYSEVLDLGAWAGGNALLEVEVFDEAGQRGVATRPFNLESERIAPPSAPAGFPGGSEPQAGCSAGGTSAPAWWLLPLALLPLVLRRRRAALLTVAAAAVVASGCGNDNRGNTIVDCACSAEQVCVDGVCVDCASDDDCAAGTCVDGICVDDTPECSDEVPCPEGFVCEDGACVTDDACEIDADCPPGQACEGGECVEVGCSDASECPECELGEAPVCSDGVCSCGPACPEGCAEGTACCYGSNSCVEVSATCVTADCPPGTRLEATSTSFDSTTCEATAECECVTLPPLDPGSIGRDLDLGVSPDGKTVVAAAYNSTYGDLMVGRVAEDGSIAWTYALGAPTTGTLTGDPAGPRGGISERGPDVGVDPSVEVRNDGTVLVSYGSLVSAEVGLHFAVGAPDGEGWTWTTFPLELGPQLGRWSDLLVDASGNPVLIYAEPGVRAEDGTWSGQVRVRTANVAVPASADDFGAAVVLDAVPSPLPCAGTCGGRRVCRSDTNLCEVPERASACDPGCDAETEACMEIADGERACVAVAFPPSVTSLPEGVGLFADADWLPSGAIAVAYYDRSAGNLRYVEFDPVAGAPVAPAVIVDGETLVDGLPTDTGDVGWFPDVFVDASGVVHVSYHDGTNEQLLEWNKGTGEISTIDDGIRCEEFVDEACVRTEVSIVGYDSALFEVDGGVRAAFQDATRLDLLERALGEFGWGTYVTLAGNAAEYDGAFGFYTDAAVREGAPFLATHRLNVQAEPRQRDVVVIER